eukprot:gene13372-19216_t
MVKKNTFVPTAHSERNVSMLEDCRKFKHEIQVLATEVTSWEKTATAGTATLHKVLNTALPRAFETTEAGQCGPLVNPSPIMGSMVNFDTFTASNNEMAKRMKEEVVDQLEAEVFNTLLTLVEDSYAMYAHAVKALQIMERNFAMCIVAFDMDRPIVKPTLPPMAEVAPAPELPSPEVKYEDRL